MRRPALIAASLVALAHVARADDPPADAGVADVQPPAEQPPAAAQPEPAQLAAKLDDLEARLEAVEDKAAKVDKLERKNAALREQVTSLLYLRRFITVFVDVGAFAVGGNGSGLRSDVGHLHFPQYAGSVFGNWVLMGDPLSTAINSLGEPADIGPSRAIKTDSIRSGGHPSLIANSLGLSIGHDVGHGFSIVGLAELEPREGPDILDVELAHIEYRPTERYDLVLQAGKIDSVLGVEYRSQDAPRRLTVTPSLLCRYTCGRPYGLSARLVHGRLSASASLTNGDNFDERFEPQTSLKTNALPTAAAHLQWMLPVGQGLEVGVSGAIGPQTDQSDNGIAQWHVGVDAKLRDLHGFDATAEYVQGKQPGASIDGSAPCGVAACLTYKAAYVLVDHRASTWFTPYVRVDWRDALHMHGTDFVYVSNTLRATVGMHFEVTSRIVAKVEYTFNRELGAIPEFPDDIVTSSLVVSTD